MSEMDEVIKEQNKRALEMATEGVPLVSTKPKPDYSNPNDCKVRKFRPGQLQNYYINGQAGNFYRLTEDLKLHEELGMSVNEFYDYVAKLPEKTAEEVLLEQKAK